VALHGLRHGSQRLLRKIEPFTAVLPRSGPSPADGRHSARRAARCAGRWYAAVTTSYVTVTDKTGARFANVSPAGDVLASEYNTKTLVWFEADAKSSSCTVSGYTVPTGKALVIKSAQYVVETSGAGGVELFADNTCNDRIGFARSDQDATFPVSYDAGMVIPQGAEVSMETVAAGDGVVFFQGYLVPATAAP
jgi:hypothetical protein